METCATIVDFLRRFVPATPCCLQSTTREMDAEVEQVSPRKTFGKGVDDSWKKIQERVFTNWINDRLRGNLKVAKKQVSVL